MRVNPEIGLIIGHLDSLSDIWQTLKLSLEISIRVLKLSHVNEFRNLKINVKEDILMYTARFEEAYRCIVDSRKREREKKKILLTNIIVYQRTIFQKEILHLKMRLQKSV